ncbi:MAG: hypothetical protein R2754_00055 [Microthrixaceae bacterium]
MQRAASLHAKGFVDAAGKESSNDLIASRLGLDPKEAKRVGKIAGGLYAKAYGDDLGQVNDAIDGIQETSATPRQVLQQPKLESMSASALDLSKIMDEDVGNVTRGVGQLMRNGLPRTAPRRSTSSPPHPSSCPRRCAANCSTRSKSTRPTCRLSASPARRPWVPCPTP